jgi:hypothetical protein
MIYNMTMSDCGFSSSENIERLQEMTSGEFLESQATSVHRSKDSQVAKESLGETPEENPVLDQSPHRTNSWKTVESGERVLKADECWHTKAYGIDPPKFNQRISLWVDVGSVKFTQSQM